MFFVTHNLFLESNNIVKKLSLTSFYVNEGKIYIDIILQGYKAKSSWLNFLKKRKKVAIFKDDELLGFVIYTKERIPG